MSAVHGIAWGLVELDETNFKVMRREVRGELRTHRIRLIPRSFGCYELVRKTKRGGHSLRQYLGYGDLKACCEIASKLITPSNPER